MKNPEIKTNIDIEGIILTEELIKELKELQDDCNDTILSYRDVISDAICFITRLMIDMDKDELDEAIEINTSLAYIRIVLNRFKKP